VSLTPVQSAARVAGVCYVVVIALGVLQAALVSSRLPAIDDPAIVAAVTADESLRFRLGLVGDVVLYVLVLVLAAALYVVVRDVHRPIALGALVLRSAEGVVGLCVTVLGGAVPSFLLSDPARADPAIALALLSVRESGLDVILLLVGPGGGAFCYLLLRSRLVPRGLALWGVLTYLAMAILGASGIVWPGLPRSITTVLFAQGAVFEVLFGLWLAVRTVDVSSAPSDAYATRIAP
jgi:hypothetical protein